MIIGHPLFVVEPDAIKRANLRNALPASTEVDSLAALRSSLAGPSIVVFGPSFADEPALGEVTALMAEHATLGGVLVASELSTTLLQTALRAGFRDVLAEPLDEAQLTASLERISTTLPSGGSLVAADPEPDNGERGRVITVFSTKGGAGSTVVATNVAVALAQQTGEQVVIVDADLQFGDVCVMLKLAPRHTVVDAVAAIERLDANYLDELLEQHSSGVKVLSAPLEPAIADQVDADAMATIIGLLRQFAGYIVVDTPAYFNDVVLTLIEESDDVLLMAGMDIPNIKNVRIGLQTLRLLDTPMAKIHMVLNRANSKVKLDISEVERTLQVKAETRIPSDVAVPQSVNKGVPIVLDSPRSGPAKALDALAKQLIEEGIRR